MLNNQVSNNSSNSNSSNLLDRVKVPYSIFIETENLVRGIDNYHIDILISQSFTNVVKSLVDNQIKLLMAGKKLQSKSSDLDVLRNTYAGIMEISLHRTKKDLSPETLAILQFGLPKYIIQETRGVLDRIGHQLEEQLDQQRQGGSRISLTTQQKLVDFRKNYSTYLYRVCRLLFKQLQREENNELRALRNQYLDDVLPQSEILMFNPLLCSRDLDLPWMLMENYALWAEGNAGFLSMNEALEKFFFRKIKKLKGLPVRNQKKGISPQSEVHDELGGLFASQNLLGAIPDHPGIYEEFCWLEEPGNIRLLFDPGLHQGLYEKARSESGFFKARSLRSSARKFEKIFTGVRKAMGGEDTVKRMYASYLVRASWTEKHAELLDLDDACRYVAGQDRKKIISELNQTEDGALTLVKNLDQLADYFDQKYKQEIDEKLLQMVTDWSRYRLHLKCFRFVHRIFSRINVITDPEKITLSREAGQLHELLTEKEYKESDKGQDEIVRHTIIKADVRGSTTVTTELMRKNLNPASYFSQRFFEPINSLLTTYGASKVFIEGDAIILSIYEHGNDPQQWYSVSRACGIARGIIDIVNSRNAHARQMQLPLLEIGIGICFADFKPLFLYDEHKPIMISSAIGDADRMSSSSWKLRNQLKLNGFSVDVLELSRADRMRGEKGQEHIRYNVNGILLDTVAFQKLRSEIKLRKLNLRLAGQPVALYVGSYPDIDGKLRELVVREGKVRVWENDHVVDKSETGEVYHEIVTNSKINTQIVGMLKKAGAA